MKAKAVTPPRSNRKQQRGCEKTLYRMRNRIERCFSKLKHFRRFCHSIREIQNLLPSTRRPRLLMDQLDAICRYGLVNRNRVTDPNPNLLRQKHRHGIPKRLVRTRGKVKLFVTRMDADQRNTFHLVGVWRPQRAKR